VIFVLKFLYITTDPFTNNSEEFVRVLLITNTANLAPSGGQVGIGTLYDQNGNVVGSFEASDSVVSTESTAYPYGFGASWSANQIFIIPPGWSFKVFGRAIAVQGSLEEVLRVN